MQSTQPDHLWLFNLIPVFVLLVSALEMRHPGHKGLESLRSFDLPLRRHKTIEDTICEVVKVGGETDNTLKCLLEVAQGSGQFSQQDIEALKLLHQDDLRG